MPFWAAEIFVVSYAVWFYRSLLSFAFGEDELLVERTFLWYRRRRAFGRREVSAVKQIKDGGEGEDSFPSWGLVVVAKLEVKVLSRQPIEKSDWLGPIIAQWAGVPFERAQQRKYETI